MKPLILALAASAVLTTGCARKKLDDPVEDFLKAAERDCTFLTVSVFRLGELQGAPAQTKISGDCTIEGE